MLGTILKISHHVGLKASQFESIPSNTCCADVSGLYKLFNLLTALQFGNNHFKPVFLPFPIHKSLNVRISLHSSCQVKGNSEDFLGVSNSPRKNYQSYLRGLFGIGGGISVHWLLVCMCIYKHVYVQHIYTKFCCNIVKVKVKKPEDLLIMPFP